MEIWIGFLMVAFHGLMKTQMEFEPELELVEELKEYVENQPWIRYLVDLTLLEIDEKGLACGLGCKTESVVLIGHC